MGQKSNVNSLHLLKTKNWHSFWYSDYTNYLYVFHEDFFIYLYLRSHSKLNYSLLKKKHTYKIEIIKASIYRTNKSIILNIHLVYLKELLLNKKTSLQDILKIYLNNLKKIFRYNKNSFLLSYKISKNTAVFLALKIASLLEKRIKFQSKALQKIIKNVSLSGIYVSYKGRLNAIDRAKKKQIIIGSVPLQTINANIDYGFIVANTKNGLQSVKVWTFNVQNKKKPKYVKTKKQ